MKSKISLAALIEELVKYGFINFSKFDYCYDIYKEYKDITCSLQVMQEKPKGVRAFCELAASGFKKGVSPIFDKYQ